MRKSDFIFGALMFLGFVAYFYVMKLVGLYNDPNLRFFNFVIHFGVVYLAMREYRRRNKDEPFSFGDTFLSGVRASIPGVLAFAIFQFFYLKFMDPGFMLHIKAYAPFGEHLTPGLVTLLLIFEGAIGTFFSSYAGMRLLAAQEHAPRSPEGVPEE